MMSDDRILLTDHPLSMDEALRFVAREDCGGIDLFAGMVRSPNHGKRVVDLEYTAFAEMVESELRKIAAEARTKWRLGCIYMAHRTGKLKPGETSVIVAVSAPHRGETFEGSRYCIEELKKRAPIWKKEFYEDGSEWQVNAGEC